MIFDIALLVSKNKLDLDNSMFQQPLIESERCYPLADCCPSYQQHSTMALQFSTRLRNGRRIRFSWHSCDATVEAVYLGGIHFV